MIERFIGDPEIGALVHSIRKCTRDRQIEWLDASIVNHPMNHPIVNHQSSMPLSMALY